MNNVDRIWKFDLSVSQIRTSDETAQYAMLSSNPAGSEISVAETVCLHGFHSAILARPSPTFSTLSQSTGFFLLRTTYQIKTAVDSCSFQLWGRLLRIQASGAYRWKWSMSMVLSRPPMSIREFSLPFNWLRLKFMFADSLGSFVCDFGVLLPTSL